jgi:hypothetical protein
MSSWASLKTSRLKKSQRAAEDVLGEGKRRLRSNAKEQSW